MQYAVLDSNMEYKTDIEGNVIKFDSVKDAMLFFTIGNFGYVEDPKDETILQYRGNPFNKLKIIPYVE